MELKGKKVTVVGMGRSALAAVELLLREGARPFVTDAAESPEIEACARELAARGVDCEFGSHSIAAFDTALIVLSPGVPPGISPVAAARARGIPVLGELELASRFCRAKILAVTGTNGKTTVTELLRAMAAACGHEVILAGNNDLPLSAAILAHPDASHAVLELSSYALETAETFHPWLAAVLNLTPDHLGRHGTMDNYAKTKARIFQCQGPGDVAVLNAGDPYTAAMHPPAGVRRLTFAIGEAPASGLWADGGVIREGSEAVAQLSDIPIPGRHNVENVLAALCMMRAGGFDWERTLAGLRSFQGVEHRIEFTAEVDGVRYYNDSKSTNIDSLRVALESFSEPLVLLAGGRGKGSDYSVLRGLVGRRVRHMLTLGEDAPLLEAAFGDLVPTERAASMADAVARARAAARPGETVLLSPGCASFDWYKNFEERGRDFKACVRRLAEKECV